MPGVSELQTVNAVKANDRCHKCNRFGHWARDCHVLLSQNEGFRQHMRQLTRGRSNRTPPTMLFGHRRPRFRNPRRGNRNSTYLVEDSAKSPDENDYDSIDDDEDLVDKRCEATDKFSKAFDEQTGLATERKSLRRKRQS